MATFKKARIGLLLVITAGPFLVFVFLYLFGKNQFEIDTYPAKGEFLEGQKSKAILLLPSAKNIKPEEREKMEDQLIRLRPFFEDKNEKPLLLQYPYEHPLQINMPQQEEVTGGLSIKNFSPLPPDWETMTWKDTILPIQTAKGPSKKRLPGAPRAFLFDQNYNLRGVYGLCNSLSIDTLMLEFKILTNQ